MDAMNVRPADIKAQVADRKEAAKDAAVERKILDVPTPAEKAATQMAQAGAAAGTFINGGDENQAFAEAKAVGEAVARAPHDQSLNELLAYLPGDSEIVDVAAGMSKAQSEQEVKEGKARTTAFADQIGAGFMEMTALPVLFRTIDRHIKGPPADPNFDYMANRDKHEAGLMEADRQFLRESNSEEDLKARMSELRTRQERYATLGAHGTGMAVAAGLMGGLIDPVGWGATMGVGKVAQMAGMGARAAAAAGQTGKAIGMGAVEGVAGNVLTEAALDAAGAHVTANDYAIAAGFGVIFGQTALLALRAPRGADDIGPIHGADGPVPPRTDIMGEGADYKLKDGTPVVATITRDKYGDREILLHTRDGELVGSAPHADAESKVFPTPTVEDKFQRRGANTLMYDLLQENGGYAGFREDKAPARTQDGIAFWNSYEPGQSKQWRELGTDEGLPTNPVTAAQDIVDRAQAMNKDLYAEAQGKLPADATPEQIKAEVDRLVLEQADFVNRTAFADVPEMDRMFPHIDDAMNADGTVKPIDEALSDPAVRADTERRWGIDETTVEDSANRMMMGEVAARAEAWAQANPVNAERIDSIMAKAPWLASTGLILARSENPVARMIAGILLESTTGAFGRRRTAAISKTMRERVYLNDLVDYETSYKQWRNKNNGSAFRDVLGSDTRSNFDRAVAMERENRRLGGELSSDPTIRTAADALDRGYNRMRLDQQSAGTVGASRLGDNSIGYVHRAISQSWVMRATNSELRAISNKLAEQLEVGWADAKFAQQIAARYIERARTGAYGGTSVPANLASPEAASALRDTLRSMSIAEADIEKAMGRFSRGGASHTKKRLELDLSERVTMDDGRSFSLMDAFEYDQASLYLQYARRVSGDVALTQYGVQGDAGLKMLRKTLEYGPDGKRATVEEMRAFDQIAAEFHGRPLDGASGNKHLGNLRMLTAASRLGGMAFTQFAELANSVALLGVTGAIKHVGQMPGLIADVYKGKPSALLSSIEQIGGPLGQDHRVVFPYQEPNDIKVYGRDSFNVFDRIVRGGSNALPWLSGWHMVHAAQVRGISEQIVHKSMRYINQGEQNAALESMGIGAELAERLRKDMPQIAQFDADGRLVALDLTKGTDHAAIGEFVQAIHRGGKQIIQGSYIGETGAWAHNDLLRMLVQFRSFSITSMEKQWTRQRVDVGTAKAFGLLAGQMAFALPIHLSRVAINATGRDKKEEYLETQLHPAMLARAVLNYTSISGLAGDVLDAGASFSGYEATGVRSGSASALGNIPSLGYLESGAKVFKQRDAREAIRMLPGGNLPFLTPVVNAAASD